MRWRKATAPRQKMVLFAAAGFFEAVVGRLREFTIGLRLETRLKCWKPVKLLGRGRASIYSAGHGTFSRAARIGPRSNRVCSGSLEGGRQEAHRRPGGILDRAARALVSSIPL